MTRVGFDGIDPAELIHALYLGTRAFGLGTMHDTKNLTVEQVRADFGDDIGEYIDYYRGRPLKLPLDLESKTFDARLYDRDAGAGAAAAIVERLRSAP